MGMGKGPAEEEDDDVEDLGADAFEENDDGDDDDYQAASVETDDDEDAEEVRLVFFLSHRRLFSPVRVCVRAPQPERGRRSDLCSPTLLR